MHSQKKIPQARSVRFWKTIYPTVHGPASTNTTLTTLLLHIQCENCCDLFVAMLNTYAFSNPFATWQATDNAQYSSSSNPIHCRRSYGNENSLQTCFGLARFAGRQRELCHMYLRTYVCRQGRLRVREKERYSETRKRWQCSK
jgi:hypothetical protein